MDFRHTRFVPSVVRPVVVVVLLAGSGNAIAEGERSPMIGGGVVAARAADDAELVGVGLEATWWVQRVGIAVEGSRRWDIGNSEPLATTFGAGLRLLLVDRLFESIIEPRDVELGLELHGVIERSWWEHADATTAYGGGIALRLRGGGDGFDSRLLAETRVFVRVMSDRSGEVIAARSTTPQPMSEGPRMTVVIGLAAVWGSGERRYADKFKPRFPSQFLVDPNGMPPQ